MLSCELSCVEETIVVFSIIDLEESVTCNIALKAFTRTPCAAMICLIPIGEAGDLNGRETVNLHCDRRKFTPLLIYNLDIERPVKKIHRFHAILPSLELIQYCLGCILVIAAIGNLYRVV